ncbi:myelin-associated oligodendrocyte basic protein isoform X1 [Dipodomys spectabilis]|uniref:myelin-associated oligodendrocyte basic protein isoform X1 n=1 Tax=Dipodomys spectabilis TaxID=105255 RepID=UPI001C53B837|nr:myelin-associated oligodendrocyte basic protein isoform X1 [Dipodomys spectabilis]
MSQKMAKEGPRLSKNQKFSEHFSIHCCPPFTFLNSKREIVDRKYSLCRSGCFYQKKEEDWICCACQKTSLLEVARPMDGRGVFWLPSTRRRARSPQRPQPRPASPPAVARAPSKPRSPPRTERQPRPRPEVRAPPPPAAKQRPRQKAQQPAARRSPLRGSGPGRGASPAKASRF